MIGFARVCENKEPSMLIVVFLVLAFATFAQSERGSITGTVADPAHAVLPRVKVAATNTQTGAQYQTVTTDSGDYTLAEVPVGTYDLNVEAPGFTKYIQQGIRIYVAQAARI